MARHRVPPPLLEGRKAPTAKPTNRGHKPIAPTVNGRPFKPYVYNGDSKNCLTCELWLGCGGAFCDTPVQRKGGA